MRSARVWSWDGEMKSRGIEVEATNDTGIRTSSVPWIRVDWDDLNRLKAEGKTLRVEAEYDDEDIREEVRIMVRESWMDFFDRLRRNCDRFSVEVVNVDDIPPA